MLKRLTIAASLLIILLVFTGCGIFGSKDQATKVQQETGEDLDQQTIVEIESEEEIPDDKAEAEEISPEELAIYEGALRLNDESYCEKIANEQLKEKCIKDLADTKIIDEAVQADDKSICKKLEGAKIEVCNIQVDIAEKTLDDMRDLTDEENEIMRRAEEDRDITICDEIESERKRENCQVNVQTLIDLYS